MGMTPAQMSRITEIAQELKNVSRRGIDNCPSESFRESFASYTEKDIDDTVQALREIYATNNAEKANMVIMAFHRCLARVVGLRKDGLI